LLEQVLGRSEPTATVSKLFCENGATRKVLKFLWNHIMEKQLSMYFSKNFVKSTTISTRASSLRLDQHLKITTHTTKPMRKWKKPLKKNSQPLLLTSGKKVLSLNEVTSCCQKSSIDYLVPPQKSVQQETILLKLKNQTLNYEEKCAVA